MSKIIAFGDSFTWGSDMNDTFRFEEYYKIYKYHPTCRYSNSYSRSTWQALLAKHLKIDYACYATEGCSNQTIVRTFFEHVHEIDSTDIVIINFTWRDRYDFLDSVTHKWENVRPTCTKDTSKFAEMYYKHIHNSYWDNIESLKAINLLIGYMKTHNIEYIVTCIDEMIYYDDIHVTPTITAMRHAYENDITWFNDVGFHQWSKDNKYPISEMWHPLEEAHQEAFNYIKRIIK